MGFEEFSAAKSPLLMVGIGDIHGRFYRVEEWLGTLEERLGRPIDFVFTVGDVEAFRRAGDHRRKATKRRLPVEFGAYADRARFLRWPLFFVGGNNEDFQALHSMKSGGELVPKLYYLGRAGTKQLGGLRVLYLSGIYAPTHFDTPLADPNSRETQKRAGYFRKPEAAQLETETSIDLMLIHEWPKGLIRRHAADRPIRAHRFPWIGNPIARNLIECIRPKWLLCGHSHVPLATNLTFPEGQTTNIACLDQAVRPEGSVFWLEWEHGKAIRAGWGLSGEAVWTSNEPWDESKTPEVPEGPVASSVVPVRVNPSKEPSS